MFMTMKEHVSGVLTSGSLMCFLHRFWITKQAYCAKAHGPRRSGCPWSLCVKSLLIFFV